MHVACKLRCHHHRARHRRSRNHGHARSSGVTRSYPELFTSCLRTASCPGQRREGRLRCPGTAAFFFHSTTVPLASALAKKVVSTCHAAAVMPPDANGEQGQQKTDVRAVTTAAAGTEASTCERRSAALEWDRAAGPRRASQLARRQGGQRRRRTAQRRSWCTHALGGSGCSKAIRALHCTCCSPRRTTGHGRRLRR